MQKTQIQTREAMEADIENCKEVIYELEQELRWIILGTRVAWPTGILAIIIFAVLQPLNIPIIQPIFEIVGGIAGGISVIVWISIGVFLIIDSDTLHKPFNTYRDNLKKSKRMLAKLSRAIAYYDEQALKHLTAEQYMHQLPGLIASYRKRADRYRNWFVITQLITIFLSAAITSLSGGWLDRYFSIPWIIPVIGALISILTSLTLFFKFREKGTNLQQTADSMDWEHMACTLGIGHYKGMTKEVAQVELAEKTEALRQEQQKKQLQLEQSSHSEQKALQSTS